MVSEEDERDEYSLGVYDEHQCNVQKRFQLDNWLLARTFDFN